jgi:hypothetical protein
MTDIPEQKPPVLHIEVEFKAEAHGTWFMPEPTDEATKEKPEVDQEG